MIIKIGKAKDNDFIANDPHVSRHHARLIREDGGNLLLERCGTKDKQIKSIINVYHVYFFLIYKVIL